MASVAEQKRARLAALLRERIAAERAPFAVSHGQRALWLIHQLDPASPVYNVPLAWRLRTAIDDRMLQNILQTLVDRHPALRTTYVAQAGVPMQRVGPHTFALRTVDAEDWSDERLQAGLQEEARRPFDLERGPVFRATLFRSAARDHVLLLTFHHIAVDMWSVGVLLEEFRTLYMGQTVGLPSALPPVGAGYGDFVEREQALLSGEEGDRLWAYWKDQLGGELPVLDMPADHPRPPVQTYRGASHHFELGVPLTHALQELARRTGVTLNTTLLAAFHALLWRYTGQDDVLVGTPTANRDAADLEGVVGYFVNPVVVRAHLTADRTFAELLHQVGQTSLAALEHQAFPFPLIVERLVGRRDPSRSQVFQAMFVLQRSVKFALDGVPGAARLDLGGLVLESVALEEGVSPFDLDLQMIETGGNLTGAIRYSTDLFDATTVARMAEHFKVLLAAAVADPDRRVSRLPLLGADERRQLGAICGGTRRDDSPDRCIHDLIASQAEATPAAAALVCGHERITYAQLNRRVNRLASTLRGRGVGPEVRVGVCLPRSVDLVVALLATLKAGGAYVPLDPEYPRERLAFMLSDARAALLITEEHLRPVVADADVATLCLDSEREAFERESADDPGSQAGPRDLAYVIYTSGSTGRPNGVAIEHRSAAALIAWARRVYAPEDLAGVLASTSVCFDLSVFELFVPLACGGTVILARDALALPSLPAAGAVTLVNTVPSAMAELLRQGALPPRVRVVNLAGEALPGPLAEAVYAQPGVRAVYNLYGPTEDTTYSTAELVPRGSDAPPTIGRPVDNTEAHILDDGGQPVPIGVTGELYLAGAGLARGYLHRPELTAERFVPHPLHPESGARAYRTGDLARRLPDGRIAYLGRRDHQVKLRGFRIELGEVETALRRHPLVQAAAATVRADTPGKRLVAYVVAEPALSDVSELRRWLRGTLPDSMIPSAFVALAELPLTPNGKLDRRALPAPERAPAVAHRAPRTPVEEILAGIFADVLGCPDVGVNEDFFELGGHSLLATQLASRAREALQVDVPLRAVFEAPTVEELAARVEVLRREVGRTPAPPPLTAEPHADRGALSFAQQRLWFLEQLQPDRATYNIACTLAMSGTLDAEALEHSLQAVVHRHEALRTTFEAPDGDPVQLIASDSEVRLEVVDLSGLSPEARAAQAARRTAEVARRPFDLARGPLLRFTLLRLASEEHVLVVVLHHIVADGWSLGVLLRETAVHYEARLTGGSATLPALPLQYADFAAWQRRWLQDAACEQELGYWREQLAGSPAELPLPTDRPRPTVQTGRGATIALDLPAELTGRLHELSQREGATLFMTLLTAFQALLARYSGQDDVVVGVPIANRNRIETEGLIGFFVNTLPLRARVAPDESFASLLRQVREATLQAYAHQDVPFDRLVEELRPERSLSRQPLVDVLFVLQNAPLPDLELPGLVLQPSMVDTGTAKFDLSLHLHETEERLTGTLEYSTDLFDAATVARLGEHYRRLLDAAAASPEAPLASLALLGPVERERALVDWNATPADPGPSRCVHERVEAQVRRTPDAPAVEWSHGALSYDALNRRANQLAHHLRELGIGPDVAVGLCLPRGPEAVISVLAVLKAGGACVPLDPRYPVQRLRAMLEDARPPVVIGDEEAAAWLRSSDAQILRLDADAEAIAARPDDDLRTSATPDDLAYVVYTSGSTGRPKGVAMAHRALDNLARWQIEDSDVPAGRTLQFASLSFDVAFQEIAATWSAGGSLVLADDDARIDPARLLDVLVEHKVERLFLPWVALDQLAEACEQRATAPATVREVISAGEQVRITPAIARFFERLPGSVLVNQYGPCETHVVTAHTLEGPPAEWPLLPPIGRPIGGTEAYVLDASLEPVPPGVAGEIYLGGAGLARGYLGRPDLTAERFVSHPFREAGRLYRSGDLGRYRPEGAIEFLGRCDDQVKIRGFRVELAEVETHLERHPAVRQACATAPHDGFGTRLVAYVVCDTPAPSAADLRRFVAATLPSEMVPAAFVTLDALPLTPSGKVDRRSLPAPDLTAEPLDLEEAPRTPTEELLTSIFAEVLGLAHVGVTASFFDQGGHSLLATRVLSRVRRAFGVELPVRTLFEAPTPRALAERVAASTQTEPVPPPVPLPRGRPLPLSFSQERLWFLDRLEPASAFYNLPAALQLRGHLDVEALRQSLDALVARHEALRTTFAMRDGAPVQLVAPPVETELPVDELTDPAEARRVAAEEARRPFDLTHGPLWRARVLKLDETEHVLLFAIHHIVADGWSLGILVAELSALYRARVSGTAAALEPLPLQFGDYAAWQRDMLDGAILDDQTAWWREQLRGCPSTLELPADRPRPLMQSFRGASLDVALPAQLVDAVQALARREGATVFMTLLAAFQLLLSRLSGQPDVVVGVPLANRHWAEIEGVIGFFVNTLPIRARPDAAEPFSALLERVREFTLGAYARQDVPFERLVQALEPDRDLGRQPLFQAMFALQNTPSAPLDLPGVSVRPLPVDTGTTRFDLTLSLQESADGLTGVLDYSTDLFDRATVERLVERYERLLEGLTREPDRPLGALSLLSEAERQQVLVEWNRTAAPVPATCAHQLVAEQAARTPDAVAVSCGGDRLTYAELARRSDELAERLRTLGVGPDTLVGLCLEAGLDAAVALMAVLKAGGAYVPLDPAYPPERLALMLADASPRVLLTHSSRLGSLPESAATVLCVDAKTDVEGCDAAPAEPAPEHLAYVIYTSGSTGRPKGVMVDHRALTNLTTAFARRFALRPGDRLFMVPSLSFDASVGDIFPAWASGATLVFHPDVGELLGADLEGFLAAEDITVLDMPAALWLQWVAALDRRGRAPDLPGLRLVVVGGESLPAEAVATFSRLFSGRVTLIAPYGPTEATVCTTCYELRGEPDFATERVPLGRPIPNAEVYLLDAERQPVPIGVTGEVYIGGAGVARGYLGQPELTAERFLPHPFDGRPGARLYRTGDLARHLPDGNLVFEGRADEQLKVRGFRIEPGEVEAHLGRHPAVLAVAVTLRAMGESERRLVAFYVPAVPDRPPSASELRRWLLQRLPSHMVPSEFVALDRLALTPSGKVDRAALPAVVLPAPAAARAAQAPRGTIEQSIAAVWQQVLGIATVGREDNFFDLGGESLLLARVQDRLHAELGRDVRMVELFQFPTVALLAEHFEHADAADVSATVQAAAARATQRRAAMTRRPPGRRRGSRLVEADDDGV